MRDKLDHVMWIKVIGAKLVKSVIKSATQALILFTTNRHTLTLTQAKDVIIYTVLFTQSCLTAVRD